MCRLLWLAIWPCVLVLPFVCIQSPRGRSRRWKQTTIPDCLTTLLLPRPGGCPVQLQEGPGLVRGGTRGVGSSRCREGASRGGDCCARGCGAQETASGPGCGSACAPPSSKRAAFTQPSYMPMHANYLSELKPKGLVRGLACTWTGEKTWLQGRKPTV